MPGTPAELTYTGDNEQLAAEIARRTKAEEELRASAEELERSNRDLEQFAYVVSHDLQQRYRPATTALEVVLSGFLSSIGVHGMLQHRIDADRVAAARDILDELGKLDLH